MKDSEITIQISQKGVTRVQIAADTTEEQTSAHLLLAMIAPELRALDAALKGLQTKTEE